MTRQSFSRATGLVTRALRFSNISANRLAPRQALVTARKAVLTPVLLRSRFLSTTPAQSRGILPDTDDPAPPNVQDNAPKAVPAELNDTEYHELADEYIDVILSRLEEVGEKDEGVDVEYAAGVLNVTFPEIGTYVINKQPPNKQIWLSSPVSGPKRYDYVLYGEGQNQKEDTAVGDWVYLRDGSTINDLFIDELDIDLALPLPQ